MEEIWRPITGYEGKYEVSNLGRIKSLERVVNHSVPNSFKLKKEKILKPVRTKKYQAYSPYRVCLYNGNSAKLLMVHRLVAFAFIKNTHKKPFINHIDCDTSNNCVSNLEWVTMLENNRHRYNLGHYNKKYRL